MMTDTILIILQGSSIIVYCPPKTLVFELLFNVYQHLTHTKAPNPIVLIKDDRYYLAGSVLQL